jgi:hypothetical protein
MRWISEHTVIQTSLIAQTVVDAASQASYLIALMPNVLRIWWGINQLANVGYNDEWRGALKTFSRHYIKIMSEAQSNRLIKCCRSNPPYSIIRNSAIKGYRRKRYTIKIQWIYQKINSEMPLPCWNKNIGPFILGFCYWWGRTRVLDRDKL